MTVDRLDIHKLVNPVTNKTQVLRMFITVFEICELVSPAEGLFYLQARLIEGGS